ncbi:MULTISPECIES: Holliday junction resolvase RuvX [unclassified Actinobaculum]|uniref:Holliday junction resolvase RuvX n=1 Tax=unclassified Actinobaculum TaxID=2609299 RepID=UPI000D525F88|nr:Holliday junction resolvase RuvX [Actinobaculum sp. 313]RTE50947.1 Holliday junction resolvase RuvX [Actinobaculum sp. 352]
MIRQGRRIAVDVGKVRIGVAHCDREAILATPLATVQRGDSDFKRIRRLVRDDEAIEVIVGLPLHMDGTEGSQASFTRRWAQRFARYIAPIPVRLVDERLSSSTAHAQLSAAGRDSRAQREVVDQAAAVVILETALEIERRTGEAPGELIAVDVAEGTATTAEGRI